MRSSIRLGFLFAVVVITFSFSTWAPLLTFGRLPLSDAESPQRIGEQSWNGRGAYLVAAGTTYLLRVRCRMSPENAAAIEDGSLPPSRIAFGMTRNSLAKEGVRSRLTRISVSRVVHRVWAVHDGDPVDLRHDGLTALLAARLPRHEIVERVNRRERREILRPADLHQKDVAVWEIHADVLLRIPTDLVLEPLDPLAPLPVIDPSIRMAKYGGGLVEYRAEALPGDHVYVSFNPSDEGRYVVWVTEDGGDC